MLRIANSPIARPQYHSTPCLAKAKNTPPTASWLSFPFSDVGFLAVGWNLSRDLNLGNADCVGAPASCLVLIWPADVYEHASYLLIFTSYASYVLSPPLPYICWWRVKPFKRADFRLCLWGRLDCVEVIWRVDVYEEGSQLLVSPHMPPCYRAPPPLYPLIR